MRLKISLLLLMMTLLTSVSPALAGSGIKKVLMVVTSSAQMTDGKPTGLWLEEFAVPFLMFKEAGFRVSVASPAGGKAPIDPRSLEDKKKAQRWSRVAAELDETTPLSAVTAERYDAVFLPGGHGTMFDFPGDTRLKALLSSFAASDKVIGAVCHGPAGLVGAKKADGTPLVAGKTITAFTDAEEKAIQLDKVVPFLLEKRLREEGAQFVVGQKWAAHTQVDGLLVTGQNPASSAGTAEAVIRILKSR